MRNHPHTTKTPSTYSKPAPRSRRSCYAIARQRAKRARREGRHRVIIFLIFIWALLSAPFLSPAVAALPHGGSSRPTRVPSPANEPVCNVGFGREIDVPAPRPSYAGGRYKTRPTLGKLMSDLRRGAARKDATAELLPRVADLATREWVADRIADGDITSLAIHVRQGRPEEVTFAAWEYEVTNRFFGRSSDPATQLEANWARSL